ncbi:TonB-dependent receptor [Cognatiluteimonas lumbrici]|uniref:TonB-dependent receptor n=1 Tax=Cognatiluteimonas lumbrici TaxID=2559601 RepID=UPI00112A8004|nr:TonB-dependent receptor [Luteimonas lumbrici]
MKTSILYDAMSVALLAAVAGATGSALAAEHAAGASGPQRQVEAGELAGSEFDLPAGELASSLDAFERQSGMEVRYQVADVAGRQARAVRGRMGWPDALSRLLRGSGLGYRRIDARTVVIGSRAAQSEQAATTLGTITVTGTRIRGGTSPSPVIMIGSEDIREQGFADLGEVVRSVPQNFSGGQNPGVAGGATTGAAGLANQNLTGGSSLNLRGLGPDATLTLLNGRRMSYGGFVQAVDISAIPVEAVDRIEILPDGASAVYGSDAVGGVGNVILQRDYDGLTVGARYGQATGGGLATREYTATAGTTWSGGGLIATYKNASTDPLLASQRDYTRHMAEPTTLYPASHLRSALLSLHQSLGHRVEFSLDALKTGRDQTQYPYNSKLLPWYNILAQDSDATMVAPGIDILLPADWSMRLGAGWGRNRLLSWQTRINLADGSPTPLSADCYCNELASGEVGAEGPLFALPGGKARLAFGVGYRDTEFALEQHLAGAVAVDGSESSRFAYAELHLPFAAPDTRIAWARRLELNLAARGERYDSFGKVTTPKVGLIYSPGSDLTFKASWGRSFKAPTLFQRYWAQQALLRPATEFGGPGYPADATVLMLGGGNPGLEPERATTRSASLVLHPKAVPALDATLTWFDIDYTDRVVQPITDLNLALENPVYQRFISHAPTVQELEALLDSADVFYNLAGQPYDPAKVVAIMYANYANVARQRIRGFDLSGSYRMDLGPGQLALQGSASWLDSSQQSVPGAETYDLSGVLFGPPRFKGRVGGVWTNGGFSVSGFANHIDGVIAPSVGGGKEKSGSFTTLDTTIRYDTGPGNGAWSDLEFGLSARNLLDRDPPTYPPASPSFAPYDSTNYSAIGRFVSLSVTKRF